MYSTSFVQSSFLAYLVKLVFFPPNVTGTEPTERELRLLVAPEVSDYYSLGTMLDLKFRRVEMFDQQLRGKAILINMKILTTWVKERTREPVTWKTLISALQDICMTKLADDIFDKLQRSCE